jgi:hypothetical protein
MGRRGLELSPQMRSRLCELKSVGMSYSRIYAIHPEIPLSTIKSTCQMEARRVNCVSLPRQGAPRVITEDERDSMVEAVTITPEMSYHALKAQEAPNASVRSIKRLFQEMGMRKWIRLKRPALTEQHA